MKHSTLQSAGQLFLILAVVSSTAVFAQTADLRQLTVQSRSAGELNLVQALLAAETPDARIAAVEALLAKYADTPFGELALEADPQSYGAMLLVGQALVATAPKPVLMMDDNSWEFEKKDYASMAHELLGLSAIARKKYDAAIAELKIALEFNADPAVMIRLADTYNDAGQPDNAIRIVEQLNARSDFAPVFKQLANKRRLRAEQIKSQQP